MNAEKLPDDTQGSPLLCDKRCSLAPDGAHYLRAQSAIRQDDNRQAIRRAYHGKLHIHRADGSHHTHSGYSCTIHRPLGEFAEQCMSQLFQIQISAETT